VDRADLRRLWQAAEAGSADEAFGPGLLGLPVVDDPAALSGAALVVLGLSAGGRPQGPAAIRLASARYSRWRGAASSGAGLRVVDYGDIAVDDDLTATFVRAHERLADVLACGATPLVLGGGSLISLPVLQVLSGKLHGRLGVVAFAPGYDVALAPAQGGASRWARALELGVVAPGNLALIGGRAAPPDAPALGVLEEMGAHTFSVADVAAAGMATVAQEALEAAAAGTEAIYLSVDVGVLEGGADPVGLTMRELVGGASVAADALLAAADICGGGLPFGDAADAGDAREAMAARVAAEIVAGVARQRA
jgi:arginase family enzyme